MGLEWEALIGLAKVLEPILLDSHYVISILRYRCAISHRQIKLQDKDSFMDCQRAQALPEGRRGGPVDLETARVFLPSLLYLSLDILAFLLAFAGLPGNPLSNLILG